MEPVRHVSAADGELSRLRNLRAIFADRRCRRAEAQLLDRAPRPA
jgi:hypothetical protein